MKAVDLLDGPLNAKISQLVTIPDSGLGIEYKIKRGKVVFIINSRLYYVLLTQVDRTPVAILKEAIRRAYEAVR